MNFLRSTLAALTFLTLSSAAMADTILLKSGDHITGTIVSSDGKEVVFKTDFAGEIKVQWAAIKEVNSDKALYVVTPEKKTVNGNVTTEGGNLVVHTRDDGTLPVPFANVTTIRSQEEQAAYEKSLHPGILEAWKGGASIGFALARGNSETTNLTTGFTADRKTLHDELTLYFTSLYSSNDLPGGGTTANSLVSGARYDRQSGEADFRFRIRRFHARRIAGPESPLDLFGRPWVSPDQHSDDDTGFARRRELHA